MKKKPKEVFKFIDIEIYNTGLIVACLDKPENLRKRLNMKCNKDASDWLKKGISDFNTPDIDNGGVLIFNPETNKPLILYVVNGKRDWVMFDVLVHEVHHFVFKMAEYRGFTGEVEHQAHLMESTFRKIRRLLNK